MSLHVDSLHAAAAGYRSVDGFDTFIIGEENTEDADRVAQMENEAVRFEPERTRSGRAAGLDFILKDLAAQRVPARVGSRARS